MFWAMTSFDRMNRILEETESSGGLFLGDIDAASDTKLLNRHKIRAVLTVAAGTRIIYGQEHVDDHLIVPAEDIESYNLSRHFPKMIDFIERNRRMGLNVLVHCFAGVSRSATTVIAYLMKSMNMSYVRANDFVRNCRRCICPNVGFRVQLREFERKLKQPNDTLSVATEKTMTVTRREPSLASSITKPVFTSKFGYSPTPKFRSKYTSLSPPKSSTKSWSSLRVTSYEPKKKFF